MSQILDIRTLERLQEDIGSENIAELLESFYSKSMNHIAQITRISYNQLNQGFASGEGEQLNFHAHALKGISRSLGCTSLGKIAEWLEDNTEANNAFTSEFYQKFSKVKTILPILFQQSFKELQSWHDAHCV